MHELDKFNRWLPGKEFPSHKTIISDCQVIKKCITKAFANVEELLIFCMESEHGRNTVQRIVRQFLVEPELLKISLSMQNSACSAIKSYFRKHDIMLDVIVTNKRRVESAVPDEMPMTLDDPYKTIRNGNPGIVMRTVMIVKFQSGMDSSTLAGRFNFGGGVQAACALLQDQGPLHVGYRHVSGSNQIGARQDGRALHDVP